MGKLDESLGRTALRPTARPPIASHPCGYRQKPLFARRYDEAIAQLRSVLDMDPNSFPRATWLWKAYAEKGMYAQALEIIQGERRYVPQAGYVNELACVHARMGDSEQARKCWQRNT